MMNLDAHCIAQIHFIWLFHILCGYLQTDKAQGGEWDHVYLDIPKSVPVMQKPYVYQWIYTAMTRAKKELYIVDGFWLM